LGSDICGMREKREKWLDTPRPTGLRGLKLKRYKNSMNIASSQITISLRGISAVALVIVVGDVLAAVP
jgi:hypothetical protein